MPKLPDGFNLSEIDYRNAPESDLARIHAFDVVMKKEHRPDEPNQPLSELVNDARTTPSYFDDWCWLVSPEGSDEVIGRASVWIARNDQNEHALWGGVSVLPDYRRRHIGVHLLSRVAKVAEDEGRTMLMGGTRSKVPAGDAFCGWLGAEVSIVSRVSELDLTTLDWAMVDRWVEEGPRRAPGYELDWIDGVFPPELYDDAIVAHDIMETAPRDDMKLDIETITREQVAEWEAQLAKSQVERWTIYARESATKRCVGLTDVWYSPWNPTVVGQGNTGVHPDHRGHALGKWLKGAMLQRIRAERTQAVKVRTDNAYSNDAMLGINVALGFAIESDWTNYQVELDTVLAKLKSLA